MTPDIWLLLIILALMVALFASDRFRLDLVALLALLALLLTGLLSPAEALAGFADPVVIMIAGLFVVGGAVFETGLADAAGRRLARLAGTHPTRLLVVVMLSAALLSAFLSSTGTVAVLLPVVATLARRAAVSPGRLLIPLAFASLLGGMLTLIGTPPNLVVNNQLLAAGLPGFHFFGFTPVGLVMVVLGTLFMATVGQRLLPQQAPEALADDPTPAQLLDAYDVQRDSSELEVSPGSPLVGRTLAEAELRSRHGVDVLAIASRGPRGFRVRWAEPDSVLRAGDRLTVQTSREGMEPRLAEQGLAMRAAAPRGLGGLRVAEVVIPPRSSLVGRSVREARFRDRYGAAVLAEKRGGARLPQGVDDPLRVGDTLLIAAGSRALAELAAQPRDFLLVGAGSAERPLSGSAPWVALILIAMLALMTFAVVANVTAVLLAAVAVVAVGAFRGDGAYRAVNWESVVLVAAVLPVATALEQTGALALLSEALLAGLAGAEPRLILLLLFAVTSLLSQAVSNTATTVLVAPLALQLALDLGISPYPLLMTVAVAASTAFATPVASPVNALVINPGGYRFGDFLRVGLPLQALILLAALIVVPLAFPF